MHRLIKALSKYWINNLYINFIKRKKSPGTKVLQNIIMKKLSFSLTPFKTTFSRLKKSSLQACDHQRKRGNIQDGK